MSWAKFDDDYMNHPKIRARSAVALRLHMAAILHCCKWATDGFIDGETLRELLPRREYHEDYVRELVGNGLLHDTGGRCDSDLCLAAQGLPLEGSDAFVVHDFRQWQITAEEWERRRAQNAERQRKWRERKAAQEKAETQRNALRDALVTPYEMRE